jgi:hypothetical protein
VRERIPGQLLGRVVTQECDGFTGQWKTVSAAAPSQGPTLEQADSTPAQTTRPLSTGTSPTLTPSQ